MVLLRMLTAALKQPNKPAIDSTILHELEAFFKRFVLLPDESLYTLVSLWVLGTHFHQQFDFFGYLIAHSPEPQSGKSRLLELLHEVVLNPTEITVAPTTAVLFRTAANSTSLLDEVDCWTNKDELKSVLNAGFQKARAVVRMDETGHSYSPQKFSVYAPRALAGIGADILDRVTRDRTFMIRMVRQKHTERREPFRPGKMKAELDKLRKDISQWVKDNREAVSARYDGNGFPYLQNFQDRTIDVSEPLAAILEIVYVTPLAIRDEREGLVKAIGITRGEQQTADDGHEILKGLTSLASRENPLIGNATELAEKLRPLLDAALPEQRVWDVLRRYDFKTKSTRLRGDDQPRYRYSLQYEALKDLSDRYIGEETPPENANAEQ